MGEDMDDPERGISLEAVVARPAEDGTPTRTEFRVLGEEMIEKKVKTSGKTGRVYLPGHWVGRTVKIIRVN
jgi:hypothetical protein